MCCWSHEEDQVELPRPLSLEGTQKLGRIAVGNLIMESVAGFASLAFLSYAVPWMSGCDENGDTDKCFALFGSINTLGSIGCVILLSTFSTIVLTRGPYLIENKAWVDLLYSYLFGTFQLAIFSCNNCQDIVVYAETVLVIIFCELLLLAWSYQGCYPTAYSKWLLVCVFLFILLTSAVLWLVLDKSDGKWDVLLANGAAFLKLYWVATDMSRIQTKTRPTTYCTGMLCLTCVKVISWEKSMFEWNKRGGCCRRLESRLYGKEVETYF
jgi:hypothetical protein